MKKSTKNSDRLPAQTTRTTKLFSNLNQPALQRFSNDLYDLYELQLQSKKKSAQKKACKKNRLKKIQESIQQVKKYLKQGLPVESPRSYIPIYYYTPPTNVLASLPQLNLRSQANTNRNFSRDQGLSERNSSVSKFPTTRNSSQEVKKLHKRNIKNRFKICVIAVYFCLLFPQFSRKFQEIRFKWFQDRYKSPFCLNHLAKSLNKRLRQINFTKIYEQSKAKSYETNKYPLISFTKLFLAELTSIFINKLTLKYHHELLGIGAVNKHFYLNYQNRYMYYPQQIPFLQIAKRKLSYGNCDKLIFSKETEILLIMIRTMFKVVLFDYLWPICSQQVDGDGEEKQRMIMIKVCTVFLHTVCLDIYKIGLHNQSTTSRQSQSNSTIQNLKYQLTNTTINLLTTNSIFCSNSHYPINNKQLHHSQQPFSYIKNMPGYKKYYELIDRSEVLDQFRPEATSIIINMVITIRQYLYEEEKSVYRFIWGLTVQQKRLLQNQSQYTWKSSNRSQEIRQTTRKKGTHRRYRSQNDEQLPDHILPPHKSITKKSSCRKISNICETPYYDDRERIRQKSEQSQMWRVPSILRSGLTLTSEYQKTGGQFGMTQN